YGVSPSDYCNIMLQQQVNLERAQQIRQIIDAEVEKRAAAKAKLTLYAAVTAATPNLEEIGALIDGGQDVNQVHPVEAGGDDGHTPLLAAARDGRAEIVKLLLERGASPEATDGLFRAYPTHKAAFFGHEEALRTLLDAPRRSDLNVRGPANGYTPLHDSIWCGHPDAAGAMLDAGAPFNLPGINGRTQLELARIELGSDHPLVKRMEESK
ncbi:MAG TPA: ankyrin repeat domain-containing protein, partial [Chthoniobacteraceae bacterium]|nr:ankyrin repeat domain-containing protein [Chthoniobacteraceae bacterium]